MQVVIFSAPGDYGSVSNASLSFPIGSLINSTSCVDVTIVDDVIVEFSEEFSVSLSSSDPVVFDPIQEANVSIIDNDSKFFSDKAKLKAVNVHIPQTLFSFCCTSGYKRHNMYSLLPRRYVCVCTRLICPISLSLSLSLCLSLSSVATASLEQASYLVNETDSILMVCVELTDGELERRITISLSTLDGSAIGKKSSS